MKHNNAMKDIITAIEESGMITTGMTSVLSEAKTVEMDSRRIAQDIITRLSENATGEELALIQENAEQSIQMIQNLLTTNKGVLSENSGVNIQLITTSMATLFRQPYECHVQRLFNTEVAATPEMVIETIVHKIKSPNQAEAVPVYEAFASPGAFTAMNSSKVIPIGKNGAGIAVKSTARVDLIPGQAAAMRVNKTLKIEGLKIKEIAGGAILANAKVTLKRGCSPYMDQKDSIINATYIIDLGATKPEVTVSAKIVNDRSIESITVSYLNETHTVEAIFIDATLSSEEHTHPITLGVDNSFRNYPIGTREHIEVGETIEKIVMTKKSTGSELSGVDIMTLLADKMTDIAFRIKDDRLASVLMDDKGWLTGELTLKQPGTQQFFKISEYINDYFFNQIDGYCTVLKLLHNFENCHFVAEISPVLAQYIDADRKIVAGGGSDGKTSFMYDLKYMSKANNITFVVAPKAPMNQVRLNLLPDDTKKTPYRTYDNFEFDSFMTDKIRRHDNPTMSAIVYSEIAQEYVHNNFSIVLKVLEVPTLSASVIEKIKATNASLIIE